MSVTSHVTAGGSLTFLGYLQRETEKHMPQKVRVQVGWASGSHTFEVSELRGRESVLGLSCAPDGAGCVSVSGFRLLPVRGPLSPLQAHLAFLHRFCHYLVLFSASRSSPSWTGRSFHNEQIINAENPLLAAAVGPVPYDVATGGEMPAAAHRWHAECLSVSARISQAHRAVWIKMWRKGPRFSSANDVLKEKRQMLC